MSCSVCRVSGRNIVGVVGDGVRRWVDGLCDQAIWCPSVWLTESVLVTVTVGVGVVDSVLVGK